MLCPIEDQRGGGERGRRLRMLCVCERSAGQRERQKRLRLHWMCWWCGRLLLPKPQANHIDTPTAPLSSPPPPPPSPSLPLAFAPQTAKNISERGSQVRHSDSWKLRSQRKEKLHWIGCSSSLRPYSVSTAAPAPPAAAAAVLVVVAVEVVLVEVWGWRYSPEQRSLEARNERAETSLARTFGTGPNASLRPTILPRLLAFLDEASRI